jgi:hypothetical protein
MGWEVMRRPPAGFAVRVAELGAGVQSGACVELRAEFREGTGSVELMFCSEVGSWTLPVYVGGAEGALAPEAVEAGFGWLETGFMTAAWLALCSMKTGWPAGAGWVPLLGMKTGALGFAVPCATGTVRAEAVAWVGAGMGKAALPLYESGPESVEEGLVAGWGGGMSGLSSRFRSPVEMERRTPESES